MSLVNPSIPRSKSDLAIARSLTVQAITVVRSRFRRSMTDSVSRPWWIEMAGAACRLDPRPNPRQFVFGTDGVEHVDVFERFDPVELVATPSTENDVPSRLECW